jgi:lycopene beta-cyclase
VIDGRGVRASRHLSLGYQKFVGQELKLDGPHGLALPILMDACVPQQDGYRFVYTLPLSADTVLVEDTFYADGSRVDTDRLRANIRAYAQGKGWRVVSVLREESGVLPITLAGDIDAFWNEAGGVARSGLAAGLFNQATGYSLPDAVRLADRIAQLSASQYAAEPLFDAVKAHATARWNEQGFFRLLNRMLFRAAAPEERWRVLERFYGLPQPLIERFYAGKPTPLDKVRILSGKPPVAIGAALRAAFQTPPARVQEETP